MALKNTVLKLFKESHAYRAVLEKLSTDDSVFVSQLNGSARSFLLSGIFEDSTCIVVTPGDNEAENDTTKKAEKTPKAQAMNVDVTKKKEDDK